MDTKENIRGKELMKNSLVSICSIVRDCQKNLKRNIPRIETLRKLFRDSEVIIFENDSRDKTLQILRNWENNSWNVHVFTEIYNIPTIPRQHDIGEVNPYFSISRIEKMVTYRNKYMQFLNNSEFKRDYVIILDLDISNFSMNGVVNSFGTSTEWDCITANGISLSSELKRQYHDSYALIESGNLKDIQTEQSIKANRIRYSHLRPGMPLVPIDSAYGGIAVYKWASIKDIYYYCPLNNEKKVQCKSEHVGLHHRMKDKGFSNIFINPAMIVKYRSVSLKFLCKKIKERLVNT